MARNTSLWTSIWLLIAHFQPCTFCRATKHEIVPRILSDAERSDLLQLSFSVWHPAYSSKHITGDSSFLLYDAVLSSLEEFMTFDADIHLVDSDGAVPDHDIFSPRLGEGSQVTFLHANSTDVARRSGISNFEIEWMNWVVTYRIVKVDEDLVREATHLQGLNATGILIILTHQSLHDSLGNGDMDKRLNRALGSKIAVMSTVEDAQANFEIAASDWNDVLDFSEEAIKLRYVGVALLWLVNGAFMGIAILAHMAHMEPAAIRVKKNKLQTKNNRLDTEGGLEYMLQISRDESMKAMAGKSETRSRSRML